MAERYIEQDGHLYRKVTDLYRWSDHPPKGFFGRLEAFSEAIDNRIRAVQRMTNAFGWMGLLILAPTKRAKAIISVLREIADAESDIRLYKESDEYETPYERESYDIEIHAAMVRKALYIQVYNQRKYFWMPKKDGLK